MKHSVAFAVTHGSVQLKFSFLYGDISHKPLPIV
jgi:hypothetical protein